MKLRQVSDGEWVQPVRRAYRLACCDCGLVHVVDFRLVRNRRGAFIQLRASRHARSTAQVRRWMHREDVMAAGRKRKPQDATLRNTRAARKRVDELALHVQQLHAYVATIDVRLTAEVQALCNAVETLRKATRVLGRQAALVGTSDKAISRGVSDALARTGR